jgi:hypothetical protein
MWFNIDFDILAIDLVPTFLRKIRKLAFVNACVSPIKRMYNQWASNRKANLYKLVHNGQVCYLRKVLNDRFDQSLRRIYIGNGNRYDRSYIYTTAEARPQFLGVIYIHNSVDYADTGIDFIVYAPAGLLNLDNFEMKALINFYKEGVKRYKIEAI